MNFEKYESANPDPEVQLQSRIFELENKLEAWEIVIAAWCVELAEARKKHGAHENLVREYERTLNAALEGA